MSKQNIIENKIDSYTGSMGKAMVALLALSARQNLAHGKAGQFMVGFSELLGFSKHLDTAWKIKKYLYPENALYYGVWDKVYMERVEGSDWLNGLRAMKKSA